MLNNRKKPSEIRVGCNRKKSFNYFLPFFFSQTQAHCKHGAAKREKKGFFIEYGAFICLTMFLKKTKN